MSEEDKMVSLLEELVKWTKVTSIPHVKKLLTEILVKPEEKIAYQISDGKQTVRQVGKQANVSRNTVSVWWNKWIKAGIAEPISVKGGTRAKRAFSLDDFGIEVPVIKLTTAEAGKNGEEVA
jgi:hypothetical protein